MNIDQVLAAQRTLAWLSQQALAPGEMRKERLEMGALLGIARFYLAEYALHVTNGMEPYDALIATAKGDQMLTDKQRDVFRSMMPPRPTAEGPGPD